jgi:T5SS/PEP-CTERM-associated repeat protein/autotransporter-associated beta strand protein
MRIGGAVRFGAFLALYAWSALARAQTVVSTTTTFDNQAVPYPAGTLSIDGSGTPTLFLLNGSTLTSGITSLTVGNTQTGALVLSGGSTLVNTGSSYLGYNFGTTGGVFVSGVSSSWTGGELFVGRAGRGTLAVTGGGSVVSGTGYVGAATASSGTVSINGTGSRWSVADSLFLGGVTTSGGGTGTVTVENGGSLSVGSLLKTWNGGTLTISGGSVTARDFDRSVGTFNLFHGNMTVSGGVYTHTGGTGGAGNILAINGATAADLPSMQLINTTVVGVEAIVVGGDRRGELVIGGGTAITNNGTNAFLGSVGGSNVFRTFGYIGHGVTGSGSVTVSGLGSVWTLSSTLYTGYSGTGSLTLTGGGRVSSNYGNMGFDPGGTGTALVTGIGSQWTMTSDLFVGYHGRGTLTVGDGGQIVSNYGYLGYHPTGVGNATITGMNSQWTLTEDLYVGLGGDGTLSLSSGGKLVGDVVFIGHDVGSGGDVTIAGADSRMTLTGHAHVGYESRGTFTVTGGGQAVVGSYFNIGNKAAGDGSVIISGGGSNLTTGTLNVGGGMGTAGGPGTLVVDDGATVNVANLTRVFGSGSLTIGNFSTLSTKALAGNLRNDGTLVIGGTDGSSTYADVISGSGIVEKTGSGTVIFTGANTYQAGTLISEGTLQIGNNSAGASIAGSVLNRGTLQFAGNDTQTMNGSISGEGGLVRSGAGTLVLSFANTYTGGTTISGGTLQLQGGNNRLATTGSVLLSGGTLEVTGTQTAATVTLNSSASSIVGSGTLNATTFDFRNGAVSARLGIGTLQKSTTSTVTISGANAYAGGTTILGGTLVAANNESLGTGSIVIGDTSGSTSATLSLNSGITIDRNITVRAGSGGSANLVAGNITGTATFSGDILLNKSVTFQAFSSGTAEFRDGTISGIGGILKTGTGTMVLAGQGNYTGATTINAGALKLGNNDALGTGTLTQQVDFGLKFAAGVDAPVLGGLAGRGSLNLTDDANGGVNLIVGGNNASTSFTGNIQGQGSLTKVGSGTLTLTGSVSAGIETTILSGALQIGSATTATRIDGPVLNNALLSFSGTSSSHEFVSISGTGSVQISGARIFFGEQSYTGVTTLAAGTLQLGVGTDIGNFQSDVVNGGALIFANSNVAIVSGTISGAGSVAKQSSGTVVLTGTNTYTGTTTVAGGTLRAVDGVGLSTASNLVLRDGAFLESSGLITRTLGTGGGQLRWTGTAGVAAVGGNLDLNLGGAGSTLTWGQANFLSITEGLLLGSVASDGRTRLLNSIDLAGGTRGVGVIDNGASTNDYSELAGKLSNGALTKGGNGLLVLTGNNDYEGGTTISGLLQIGDGGATGSAGTGAIVFSNSSAELIVNRSGTITFTQSISGMGDVRQIGSGTTVLLGANYTGATRISAGTLELRRGGLATIFNDAHLVLDIATDQTQVIVGTGDFTKRGVGTLSMEGFGYAGTTTISAGTLQVQFELDEVTGPGAIVNNSVLRLGELSGSNFDLTKSISGTGSVVIEGGHAHLSGNNTYSGTTTLVGDMSGNLSAAGNLAFAGNTSQFFSGGILETTGSFTRALGTGAGEVRWVEGRGGFRPVDGNLTVNIGGDARQLVVGQPHFVDSTMTLVLHDGDNFFSHDDDRYSNRSVQWLNPIDVNGSVLNVAVLTTPTEDESYADMAGVISNGALLKSGIGTLVLSAANTYSGPTTVIGTLRATDGAGLPTQSALVLAGQLQSHGSFNRSLGTGAGQISWIDTGGFRALGGDLTVNLGGGGAEVTWGIGGFVPTGKSLVLGLSISEDRVTFVNDVDLNGADRSVSVGASSNTLHNRTEGEMSGDLRNGGLQKIGAGTLILSGANTYSGRTTVLNGTLRAVDGVGLSATSNLVVASGAIFESNGSFTRALGTAAGQVTFTSGSFSWTGLSAHGGDLTVSLFGDGRDVGLNQFGNGLSFGSLYADARTVVVNGFDLNGNGGRQFYAYDNVSSTADYGEITGVVRNGGVRKTGDGLLVLSGDNTYALGTTIVAGTLRAGHNHALGTGTVIIQNGARLDVAGGVTVDNTLSIQSGGSVGGSGTINSHVVVGNGGIVSPGNSPGTQSVLAETWATGGNYLWEINDVDGGIGIDPGWDWINITNQLNITANAGGKFNILVTSLALSNSAGPVHDFNQFSNYSWVIASAGGGVTGFDSSAFHLNTAGFQNGFNGSFGISLVGNDITLTYSATAVPEPTSLLLVVAAAGGMAWRRRRRRRKDANMGETRPVSEDVPGLSPGS